MFKNLRIPIALCLLLNFFRFAADGAGFPRVRNFSKERYSAGAQNWCAVQDSLGKIYIGNRDCILVFDGERWRHEYLSNYTTVRSLMFDEESGRLYAGGSEEFGFFCNDSSSGNLLYHSVSALLADNHPSFSEIWNIFKYDNKIIFQADNCLFIFDEGKLNSIPLEARVSTTSMIGSRLYIALENGSIKILDNNIISQIGESNFFNDKKIVSILPCDNKDDILIATSLNGLFLFHNGGFSESDLAINDFLKSNQIFCGDFHDRKYVFGTVSNGAVLLDLNDNKIHYINRETGLQNNTVLNIKFDFAGNIWLCLDNGVDYVVYNSPLKNLISSSNPIGAGYFSLINGGNIFYGTNEGLFTTSFPYVPSPGPQIMNQALKGQIWSMTETPHGVLIASDTGVYHYNGSSFVKIGGVGGSYKILPVPSHDDLALASTYEGFHLLKFNGNSWIDHSPVAGCDDLKGNFLFDKKGDVWFSHWRKGVFRLSLDLDNAQIKVSKLFNSSSGLPTDELNTVAVFYDDVVITTREGFFMVDRNDRDRVVRSKEFNDVLKNRRYGSVQSFPDESLIYSDTEEIYLISRLNGKISVKKLASGNFKDSFIPGFVHFNLVSPSEIIVSTQDGFISVDTNTDFNGIWNPRPFVSSVYANQDSLVYSAGLSEKMPVNLKLPFSLNSLKFEFAYPDFENEGVIEYSSYLENYESDWSPYSSEAAREYTRLSEGEYKLHLRAKDINSGKIKEAAFGLKISPPWYRNTFAKILYFISGLLFLALLSAVIRHWISRASSQAELRKEREMKELRKQAEKEALLKDYEIASLKTEQLEQDIKHKNQELSTTAMSLIHKNEILNDLSVQLAALQELAASGSSGALLQRKLSKIQSSIEKSINEDNDRDNFNKNFDLVYGDYTKKLSELHPNLSISDKRLCCYIRMGLSSKEIAPLINISYKSVEMARYRLRKKINLASDISLSDYLFNI